MHIGVLFSYGVSLDDWYKSGLIDREIEIYNELSKKFTITFITYGNKKDYKYQNKIKNIKILPIYSLLKKRKNKFINFIITFFFPIIFKKHFDKINILKCNQMWGSWIAVLNRIINSKKYILRCGYELYQNELNNSSILRKIFYYLISVASYKFSSKIIVTTNDIKKFIINNFKIKAKKIVIIPNFINIDKFNSHKKKREDNFLYVGRLSEEKNLFYILNFFKQKKYKLYILGSGKLKSQLLKYKKKNNLNVFFLRNVGNNKMPSLYNRYKFFILMSKYEGNPKSLLEAMACGCICFVSRARGIKNIISNKSNGVYIKDHKDFNKKFEHFKSNSALCSKISKNAIDFVKKRHSFNILSDKEYKLFLSFNKKCQIN